MRLPLIAVLTLLIAGLGIDTYIYYALRRFAVRRPWRIAQIATAALFNIVLVAMLFMPVRTGSETLLLSVMWIMFSYLSIYFSKFIFILFDAVSLLPLIKKRPQWKALSYTGTGAAALAFILMWWGALFNRFNIRVNEVEVEIPGLPANLAGLRIAQISDMHLGTYGSDTTFISSLVDQINSQHPDIVVFTGDIVNRNADELVPFVSVLSRLKAPHGIYSILGNHDYGDYVDWDTPQEKEANMAKLLKLQHDMGWKMLNNEHQTIVHRGDTLMLVGVENVGDPPFRTYGDLNRAYPTPSDHYTKILLSHNPAHWQNDIAGNDKLNFALTLSGHTHAMQIELLSLSPAVFRYEQWGGLYDDGQGHNLYVNIGTGTVGMPARIGATPELTILTLKNKKQ